MKLSLGISPCPNDVFIFAGILLGAVDTDGLRFTVDFQDVENLNGQAQRGDLDVVKISYANYIHIEDRYALLDCGGALGRGVGPLLLANGNSRSGALDPEREILVPGQYTTANFLLDFYLKRPVPKRFLPFDALYDELCCTPGTQGVVIHEKRFTFERDGLTLIQDLGTYWEARSGYAIPLGAIAARRSLLPGLVPTLETVVRRSLQWAYDNPDPSFALCRKHAQELSDGVIQAHINLYVNEFSRDLGAEGRDAVQFFLSQQRSFLSLA